MKRSSIVFLQGVIVLISLAALAFLLWEPHLEGRNINATLYQIYFNDPFLAYVYTASIVFFVALYQAFTLLGYIGRNQVFTLEAVKAVRRIKYCALVIIAFLIGAEGYINIVQRKVEEDIAGGAMMGLVMILISGFVATAATVFERKLQRALNTNPGLNKN